MNRRTLAWMLPLVLGAAVAGAQEDLLDVFRPSTPAFPAEASSENPFGAAASPAARADDGRVGQLRPPEPGRPAGQEVLPRPSERVHVPLAGVGTPGEVQYEEQGDRISLVVRDASPSYVLSLLAERRGLNIVAANDLDAHGTFTFALYNKTVEETLTAILSVANSTWTLHNGIVYVTSLSQSAALPPELQGRRIQVFHLDYVAAQSMLLAIQSFLSPVGQAFISESDPQDNRRTQEVLVVEDVPYALERIALFVHQMDQPPRQVLIEAHILQVDLDDNRRHGVNFEHLFNMTGNNISLGLATDNMAELLTTGSPGFMASVSGGNLTALVELLKSTTDAKTLASPRLLVLNEQQARLQVGEQLGYRQTVTTETSTNEGVAFLDVGVILEITPRITRDNRILLHVRPEVSGGQVNPETGLPDSETAHLETNVLLENGYGVVIGGLIQETDSIVQSKLPYVGDLFVVGKLFQREEVKKNRSEIIVVLIPRIYPYVCDYAGYENGNVVRAETGLLEGPLLRKYRPWEPRLPEALSNPRQLSIPPVGKVYRYPAAPIERAATPQPQRRFPVPRRPGPAVNYHSGEFPVEEHYGEQFLQQEPPPPDAPIRFATDAEVAPRRTGSRQGGAADSRDARARGAR